jgi:hypothetical protein
MAATQQDSLSPEKLQLFVATLAGLPRDEVRKAKSLYVRNAISEYRAARESLRGFRPVLWFFAIIPIFWPMLYAMRRGMNANLRLARERIANAIAVWKDDLEGETFELDGE